MKNELDGFDVMEGIVTSIEPCALGRIRLDRWLVSLRDGDQHVQVAVTTNELQNFKLFHLAALREAFVLPLISAANWNKVLSVRLAEFNKIPARAAVSRATGGER